MTALVEIIRPETEAEIAAAKALCEQYVAWLGEDICFQGIEAELKGFPALYAPPGGALRLAVAPEGAVGVVALKKLDGETCEMKRLYVEPSHWGKGTGRALAEAIISAARTLGYRKMRLDTLERLSNACRLYRRLGFREIAPYNDNPLTNVLFFELDL